jgi:DNA-binding NarL/FixJ family response regulator
VRVVIAEDSMLVREGLRRLLAEHGCEVAASVPDAASLHRAVAETAPDAVLLDIRMPPSFTDEGITAAQQLRATRPGIGIVLLSQYLESGYAMQLLEEMPAGVGYLLKDRVADVALLVDALRRVREGECVLDPTIVTNLIRRPRTVDPLAALTPRELDVLTLMAEGRSNSAIAERLGLSPKTLEAHISRLLQKLDLPESPDDHRRVLAVLRFLRAPAR